MSRVAGSGEHQGVAGLLAVLGLPASEQLALAGIDVQIVGVRSAGEHARTARQSARQTTRTAWFPAYAVGEAPALQAGERRRGGAEAPPLRTPAAAPAAGYAPRS